MGYGGLFYPGKQRMKSAGSSLYRVDGEDLTVNPRQTGWKTGCATATSPFWMAMDL